MFVNNPPGSSSTGSDSSGSSSSSGSSGSSSSSGATTVTGDAVSTRYGDVQVQITVADGKVTSADVTQVPWRDHKDQEINSRAVPILNEEAVSAYTTSEYYGTIIMPSVGFINNLSLAMISVLGALLFLLFVVILVAFYYISVMNGQRVPFYLSPTHMGCDEAMRGRVVAQVERAGLVLAVVKDRRALVGEERRPR